MDLVAPHQHAPTVAAWDHPLAEPNLEDARIAHALAPLADVPVLGRVETAVRRRFRLKSWQYMTAVTDELFVAFVVGTAGFASNGFVYAAELPGGKVHKRFAITPLTIGTQLAPSSTAGAHRFGQRDLAISIENRARSFSARVDARTDAGARLHAELELASAAAAEHLAICVPLPGERWNYTHKFAAFDVTGHVTIDGRRVDFAPGRSFGTLDFTKMFALRHSVWRWVALCGRTKRGAVVGLNLVDPTPSAPISENAVWLDGRCEPVTEVHIDRTTVAADSVDLTLREVAAVEQKLDLPLVRHRLRHVVGAFSGRVRTRDGLVHELDSVVGIAEDWDTWW